MVAPPVASALGPAIGNLLPAAVAVALSPIPIVAIVLVLATPRARANGLAFSLGWIAGLAAVSVIVLLVAGGASEPGSAASDGVDWLQIGLGVTFLLLAGAQWRKRPRGDEPEMPAWMQTVDRLTAMRAAGLGFALSALNPKNLALTLAATAAIVQEDLGSSDTVVAVAVFVAVGSATVVGSTLFAVVAPRQAAAPLDTLRGFMVRNSAVIMFVLLLLLGAKFLGDGLGGAWS